VPEKMKGVIEQPQLQYLSFRIESDLSTSFDYDDLELGKQLARGGFGTVYNAKWRGSEVAVKMLSQDMVPEEKEQVQREISLMR
jgi:serine/threonine protein kinase